MNVLETGLISYNSGTPPAAQLIENYWLHWGVFVIIVLVFVLVSALIFAWVERRMGGRFQARLGPNRTGPFGLLQLIADAIKMLLKEDLVPSRGDRLVLVLAPIVAFVPVLLIFAVIPFQEGALLADLNIGILYIVAVSSVTVIGVFMAGWASNNKYSLLGAMRAIAQIVSYEIPMGLAIVSVVLLAGSLSMSDIVAAQDIPFFLLQPLGCLIFFIAALAEINRTPFDVMEADSEIVAGYHIEYSGMKFGLFLVAEYAETLAIAAIVTTIFLGGWRGPVLPPVLWFLIKVFAVFFVTVWIRMTIPRVRIDQIMGFAWKFLLPLALINMVITGIEVTLMPKALPWPMIFVNMAIAAILIVLWSKFFKPGGGRIEV